MAILHRGARSFVTTSECSSILADFPGGVALGSDGRWGGLKMNVDLNILSSSWARRFMESSRAICVPNAQGSARNNSGFGAMIKSSQNQKSPKSNNAVH